MSRETKFRVWDELLGEMFYEGFTLTENGMVRKCGWYLRREKERRKRQDETMAANNGKYCEPKYPQGLVVLQFTGLCDKNGKEIYERDRVMNTMTGKLGTIVFSHIGNMSGWTGYWVTWDGSKAHWPFKSHEVKIIGTVHDELIEEKP